MAKEYIEREAFIRKLEFAEKKEGELSAEYAKNPHLYSESVKYGHGEYCYLMARRMALEVPTADVVEVVHGEWKKRKNWRLYVCSACSHENDEPYRYCPNCGAKMDGKGDENQ